eukprot:TRINITY_DN8429_c0_g3_i1.p1 TRINITY_DN8429_c0_g3~~TRINITY_DN8429_c0_g3_i1.p1  ORF type:complete len:336 (+),score=43.28 TRINITY_DN8429_c0_g3_i1:65-1072(+)
MCIRDRDKGKLFRLYHIIEDSREMNKKGVGLGLTISKNLAGLLGPYKKIFLKSEYKKGSKFTFYIHASNPTEGTGDPDKDMNTTTYGNLLNSRRVSYTSKDIPLKSSLSLRKRVSIEDREMKSKSVALVDGWVRRQGVKTLVPERPQDLLSDHGEATIPIERSLDDGTPRIRLISTPYIKKVGSKIINLRNFKKREIVKKSVLIVDDTPFNLVIVENQFRELHLDIEKACNGEEAVNRVIERFSRERRMFDAIFMDCNMPIMDGYHATELLKDKMKAGEIGSCPIIAMTAFVGAGEIKKCLLAGYDDYLSKPCSRQDLIKMFNKWTEPSLSLIHI